jgi:hypothetical protein
MTSLIIVYGIIQFFTVSVSQPSQDGYALNTHRLWERVTLGLEIRIFLGMCSRMCPSPLGRFLKSIGYESRKLHVPLAVTSFIYLCALKLYQYIYQLLL